MPCVRARRCRGRLFRAALILAVVRCCLSSDFSAAADAKPSRPNILLILADDVGYSDYGCYGGEIATPNIDRLAADGLKFTQFYNNSICVPTRYSLLTGLYPRHLGAQHRISLSPEVTTAAEVLRAAGYRTSLSGKWHLGTTAPNRPIDRGFEEYYGLTDGCSNHFNPSQRDPEFEGGRIRKWMHNAEFVTEFPSDFYSTDAITEHACKQIRRFAEAGDAPFFVHVCFTAAHSPLHAKPADIAKYAGKYSGGWDELRAARLHRQREMNLFPTTWDVSPREPEFSAWADEPLKEWNANLMTVYAAMVDCIDQNVGKLLATLRETDRDQNTIVLLLNDNGGCAEQAGGDDPTNIAGPKEHYVSCGAGWAWAQNTPFRRYKSWANEGGIATPLVVRWPEVVKAGTTTNEIGHIVDLLPTLAEACRAEVPTMRGESAVPTPEGLSLLSILRGGERNEPAKLYWAPRGNYAVRWGDWKLVWNEIAKSWELYDVAADRTEMHDLAEREPERVAEMRADYNAWAERTGAIHSSSGNYRLKPTKKQ